MRSTLTVTLCVAAAVTAVGCSKADTSATPDGTDTPAATVSIDGHDLGQIPAVSCTAGTNDTLTINVQTNPPTSVLLTHGATSVNYISMDGSKSNGRTLTYVTDAASSGMQATVSRADDTFTISGTAIGSIDNPEQPNVVAFEIVATCPAIRAARPSG